MKRTTRSFGKSGQYLEYMTPNPKGIILYFHGLGQVGKGIESIEDNELPKLIKQGLELNCIVIAPYLEKGDNWPASLIKSMFGVLDSYGIEQKHVTGLSLGGIATIAAMNLAYTWRGCSDYFKTAGIVCGKTAISDPEPFRRTKIVWWHGKKDSPKMPYLGAKKFIDMLKEHGHENAELITYQNDGHSIWNKAYPEYIQMFGFKEE
ncbi:MAG: hypothetical protein EBW87_00045 [Burkholderiaceae bacterium]|nr:hypothetical protein [Burkholderiaceae bacterium]